MSLVAILPSMGFVAAGMTEIRGTVAHSLPPMRATLSGVVPTVGPMALTLPKIGFASAGIPGQAPVAFLESRLPGFSIAVQADYDFGSEEVENAPGVGVGVGVVRWTFTDPETSEFYTFPINPQEMSSFMPARSFSHSYGPTALLRTFSGTPEATSWSFQGKLYNEAQYNTMRTWCRKGGPIVVTDHLNRSWEILIQSFVPLDRKPRADKLWRFSYTVNALILRGTGHSRSSRPFEGF